MHLPAGKRMRLGLDIALVADNAKEVARQLEKIVTQVPEDDASTILELNAAAHLQRTIQRSLEAKADALAASSAQ